MGNLLYASPFFIVENLQASVAFYVNHLGFEVRFTAPADEPFFAIVGRDQVSIMLKGNAADIKPAPNHTHHDWGRWDAFIYSADPDALYKEYLLRGLGFNQPLLDDNDGLRGFEVADADGYILFFGHPKA
ncbi:MAG TPA: VOC family protein [Chitinophagaceae bacterium]|nr:VOC family protein [Chitinophagaceae bacterium]